MKTVKRMQMQGFEGQTLQEFVDSFNRGMEWVTKLADTRKEPVVDIATLRGFVIYEQTDHIPEGIRDVLDLAGLRAHCENCKHFELEGRWGRCQYCKNDLRPADEACGKFFRAWESGDCWLRDGREEDELNEAVHEYKRSSLRDLERCVNGRDREQA